MNTFKRLTRSGTAVGLVALFLMVGVAYAATSFSGEGTVPFDSIRIGAQGTGGVTFFNGSIINETTTDGAGIPVTFADDVRIDGRVWRGAAAGTADSQPFIVNDNMQVVGSFTAGSLADNLVTTDVLADDSVTPAKIEGTGGTNLPIAYGVVNGITGALIAGSSNISAVERDDGGGSPMYYIQLDGVEYDFNSYATVVTPVADAGWAQTFAVDGQLVVYFQDETGNFSAAQMFSFVTYRIDSAASASAAVPRTLTVRGESKK